MLPVGRIVARPVCAKYIACCSGVPAKTAPALAIIAQSTPYIAHVGRRARSALCREAVSRLISVGIISYLMAQRKHSRSPVFRSTQVDRADSIAPILHRALRSAVRHLPCAVPEC
jgi:hypothetical protein